MKRRTNLDPRQITVGYAGSCHACGAKLLKGVNAYYWPNGSHLFCLNCGDAEYRQFQSHAQDEDFFTNRSY